MLGSEKILEDNNLELHAKTLRLWPKEAGIWQPSATAFHAYRFGKSSQ
jgi:hypothetical protein